MERTEDSNETFNSDIREYMLGKERFHIRTRFSDSSYDVPSLPTQVALLLRLDRQREEDLLTLSKEYDACKEKEKTLECTLWLEWLLVQIDGLNAERTKISLAINRLHEAQRMISILQDGHQDKTSLHVTEEQDINCALSMPTQASSAVLVSATYGSEKIAKRNLERDVFRTDFEGKSLRNLQDIGEDDVLKLEEMDSSTEETCASSTSQDRLASFKTDATSYRGGDSVSSEASPNKKMAGSSTAMDQLGQLSSLLSNLQFTPRSKSSGPKKLKYFQGDQPADSSHESGWPRYVF
eukprot:751118-Hanusia_phi.AAC.2